MTDKAELLALALRCERASGPDRELDAAVSVAACADDGAWIVTPSPESIFSHQPGWYCTSDNKSQSAPAYTSSLDAAISLVPDQHRSGVLHHVLADIQRTGFPHMTFLQRLILGVVSEALRALASEQPA